MNHVINVQPQIDTTGKTKNTPSTESHETRNHDSEIASAINAVQLRRMHSPNNKRKRGKTRGFKMLLLIVVVFIICWSPHFILIFYSSITHVNISFSLKALTTWLTFLNSALNPFIYGFLNGNFRSNLNKFLGGKMLCCGCWKMVEDSQVFYINHKGAAN